MPWDLWVAFVALWFVVGLPLGPNAVATISAALSQGGRRAFLVPLGITLAGVVHALVATLGFGAVLLASAEAFLVLKLLGVGYLIWLALRLLRRNEISFAQEPEALSRWALVRRGCLISLSNPKAILTYMAVFPQFVSPTAEMAPALAVLLPTSAVITFVIYGGYALLALPLRRWCARGWFLRGFSCLAAGFYLFAATALALTSHERPGRG